MTYFSQTDSAPNSSSKIQSTSKSIATPLVSVVFQSTSSEQYFSKDLSQKKGNDINNEELTKDEEDKFYKKAFKTSLI
jgi:hypothetical protein